jgi:hypothetical protein
MNSDDFEKRLRQQTVRSIPSEWRQEILQKANAVSELTYNSKLKIVLSELFWPCRHAWTGMAALWLVMWGINSGLSGGESNQLMAHSAPIPAMLQAMEEQRQLLAELVPPANSQPAEPPRRHQPQPRSEMLTIWIIG